MPNGTYGGVRGRKTKVGRKLSFSSYSIMLAGSRCLFRRCPFHRCLASSSSAKASPANIFFPMGLPGSSISATAAPLATAPPLATARPLATTSPLVAAPRPATFQHSAPASNISAQRPGPQQTSSGGEKYSGLASNLAHLGRIC